MRQWSQHCCNSAVRNCCEKYALFSMRQCYDFLNCFYFQSEICTYIGSQKEHTATGMYMSQVYPLTDTDLYHVLIHMLRLSLLQAQVIWWVCTTCYHTCQTTSTKARLGQSGWNVIEVGASGTRRERDANCDTNPENDGDTCNHSNNCTIKL